MAEGECSPDTVAKVAKAREFLFMAELALEGFYWDAAASLAVSAAINSADALTNAKLQYIHSGDHHSAAARLRKSGYGQVASNLSRVLTVKDKAQYSVRRCSDKEARAAVLRAGRLLRTVETILRPDQE